MGKKPTEGQWKLVEFDAPTWHALNLLSRESMKSFQDLAADHVVAAGLCAGRAQVVFLQICGRRVHAAALAKRSAMSRSRHFCCRGVVSSNNSRLFSSLSAKPAPTFNAGSFKAV